MSRSGTRIESNFAKSYRDELTSGTWMMQPIFHRVWHWLKLSVQHKTYLFPTPGPFGIYVLPGQKITSIRQIAEGVKWTEWGKEVIPNSKTIKTVLEWLESNGDIEVTSNTKGTLINIVNWISYNKPEYQEVTENIQKKKHFKLHGSDSGSDTNKNDKNEKNEKNKNREIFTPPSIEEIRTYCLQRNNGVDPQRWFDFYQSKGWMVGKNKMRDWQAAVRTWEKPASASSLVPISADVDHMAELRQKGIDL